MQESSVAAAVKERTSASPTCVCLFFVRFVLQYPLASFLLLVCFSFKRSKFFFFKFYLPKPNFCMFYFRFFCYHFFLFSFIFPIICFSPVFLLLPFPIPVPPPQQSEFPCHYPLPPIEPSAPPQDVKCLGTRSTAILVSWRPPPAESQNGVLDGYSVRYRALDLEDTEPKEVNDIPPTTNQILLEMLEKWTEYRITVVARTKVGPGPESSPIIVRTDEDGNLFPLLSFIFL